MSTVIDNLERAQLRRVPNFAPGDRVKVHFQVIEGERRRTQVFEGVVIARQGSGARETFTVRKQSFGVGVERTFPVHSPKIEKIDVAARGDVRRAKLYYLRDRVGKGARVRERDYYGPEDDIAPGLIHEPVAAAEAPAGEDSHTDADAVVDDVAAVDAVAAGEADVASGEEGVTEEASVEVAAEEEAPTVAAAEDPAASAAEDEPVADAAEEPAEADSSDAAPAAEEESEQPADGSDEPSGDAA